MDMTFILTTSFPSMIYRSMDQLKPVAKINKLKLKTKSNVLEVSATATVAATLPQLPNASVENIQSGSYEYTPHLYNIDGPPIS
jgi:hypothetical protein